jgi:DNA-binding beta-propeller fold protein YncE
VHKSSVWKLDAADGGKIKLIAGPGNGAQGFQGDGGPATGALFDRPHRLALDRDRTLYIGDLNNHRVRGIDLATGAIRAVVGDGVEANSGDGGPAAQARIGSPQGLAVDANGALFVADWPANAALLDSPASLALAPGGRIYFADAGNHRIRVIEPDGTSDTFAGGGQDAEPGALALLAPSGVAVSESGDLWTSDSGRNALRKISADGQFTSLTHPFLKEPRGLRVTRDGVLAALPASHSVVRPTFEGGFTRLAGDPHEFSFLNVVADYRRVIEGGTAAWALHLDPLDMPEDRAGSVFLADSFHSSIRKLTPEGLLYTTAPDYEPGEPPALAMDAEGRIYVADRLSHIVVWIGLDGSLGVSVGTGTTANGRDGLESWRTAVPAPEAVAVDAAGNLYVAGAGRVRKVLPDGRVFIIAGGGTLWKCADADGRPAREAELSRITALAIDGDGVVHLTERGANRLRLLVPGPY